MHSLYNFVSGPLVWLAFIIFIGGCLYRLITLIVLVHKKEKFIYTYMSWKYSLRSIVRWSTPFATENMRRPSPRGSLFIREAEILTRPW